MCNAKVTTNRDEKEDCVIIMSVYSYVTGKCFVLQMS